MLADRPRPYSPLQAVACGEPGLCPRAGTRARFAARDSSTEGQRSCPDSAAVRSAVAAGCAAVGAALNAIAAAAVSFGPAAEPNPATARVAGRFGCPVVSVAGMIAAELAITRVSLQARAAGTSGGGPVISGLFLAVITFASSGSCTPPAPLTRVLARTNLVTDRPALTRWASSGA